MWRWLTPVLGLIVSAAFPLGWHIQTLQRERQAEQALLAIGAAQSAFRGGGGAGGFATDLASLQAPCAGLPPIAPAAPSADAVAGYVVTLRPERHASQVGVDCHGRPTSSDYYAAVSPRPTRSDGRRAYAMTSGRRLFAFVDGIAPTELDMAPGGLAIARDDLATFKIP